MNIAVVDDVKQDRDQITSLLKEYAAINRLKIVVSEFSSAEEFLSSFRSYAYGFVFMDIYMDNMNGTEAAKIVRAKDPDIIIIFLTTSDEHMPDAFRVHAYDYIGKPAEKTRIFNLLDECIRKGSSLFNEPVFSFVSNREQFSLPYSNIKLIKTSNANYLEVTDKNNNTFLTRMTFQTISDELMNDTRFLQIIRGVLVNMDYVIDVFEGQCMIEGAGSIPLNVKKARELQDTWLNYKFAKKRSQQKQRRLQ